MKTLASLTMGLITILWATVTTAQSVTTTAEFYLAINHTFPRNHDPTILYMKPSGTNNLTPNISLASTFYIAKTSELWAITYSTTPPYIRPQPVCFPNSTRNVSSAVFATHEQEICEKDVENRFYFQEGLELELVWENSYFKGGDGDFAAFCVKEEKDGCVLMVEKDAGRLRGCEVVDIFVLPISD